MMSSPAYAGRPQRRRRDGELARSRAAGGEAPQHGVLAALAQAVYLALRLRQPFGFSFAKKRDSEKYIVLVLCFHMMY